MASSVASDFKNAVGYHFDYQVEVASFYKERPDLKDQLYFLRLHDPRLVRGGQKDGSIIRATLRENHSFLAEVEKGKKEGSSFFDRYQLYNCIVVNTRGDRQGLPRLMGAEATRGIEAVYIFDHEIGHAIGGVEESVADAFALIRHVQRFGAESKHADSIVGTRAVELFFRDDNGLHFTSPVTKRLLYDIRGGLDVAGLNLIETSKMAVHYAKEYALNVETVADIATDAKAFSGKLADLAHGDHAKLKEFAEYIENCDVAAAREWGHVALRSLLAGDILCDNRRIKPEGAEWDKLRSGLNPHLAPQRKEMPGRRAA